MWLNATMPTWQKHYLMLSHDRVIIDTSAFYALVSSVDKFHGLAKPAYERLLEWEWELWTTSYVLVETAALVHHRLGFKPLKTFMEIALSDLMNLFWVERATHKEAWSRMEGRQGKALSLVDWSTIVATERLRATVFTFDEDFSKEGILTFPRWKLT